MCLGSLFITSYGIDRICAAIERAALHPDRRRPGEIVGTQRHHADGGCRRQGDHDSGSRGGGLGFLEQPLILQMGDRVIRLP